MPAVYTAIFRYEHLLFSMRRYLAQSSSVGLDLRNNGTEGSFPGRPCS